MIVVRDVFRLKFGQSKAAIDLWKEGVTALQKHAPGVRLRLLTDLAGQPFYTVVLEATYDSLTAWEAMHTAARTDPAWRDVYAMIQPLTEEGHREILSVAAG